MLRYTLRNVETHDFPCPEGMPEALHALLVARGIRSAGEAEAFLNPGVRDLADPMRLSSMAAAVARIRGAMQNGETICVYGDYDVDGVCASAILSLWLKSEGADARVYLPSRHSEGYGLNEGAIREIAGWATLMVTVDCGVTSVALVALAKELGLDVIVTDHHRPGDQLPDCPVVNPLLNDYPFPYLCGAGVAFKLVWALGGRDAALGYVDVAALATVADVVSLTGENRAIVRMGLDAINGGAPLRPGIAALIEAAGLTGKRITSTAVAFQLAPRLNAGGRLGSAMRSLELVTQTDPARARAGAEALEEENARRREVETEILRQAKEQLEGFDFTAHRALILAGKGWNPGVIGLAASRLVEAYNYPVILLADQGDRLTGSCRSIEGVDIHAALTGCAHTLERFGGHRQAAGLTLLPDKLEAFRAAMDDWLWRNVDPSVYIPVQAYDAPLEFADVTTGLIAALEGMQPTGFGNPAPLFRATARVVEARAVGAEKAHLRLTLAQGGRRLGAIAFRQGRLAPELTGSVDALFAVKLDTYMGRSEPQLELRSLSNADVFQRLSAKLGEEPPMICEFLTEVFYNKKIVPFADPAPQTSPEALEAWMSQSPQGTLVIAGDIASAGRLLRRLEACAPDLVLGRLPEDPRAFNAVCVCPSGGSIPPGYRRLVLVVAPEECVPAGAPAEVHSLGSSPAWMGDLPDLDAMRDAYRALMRVMRRPVWCRSMGQLARLVAAEAGCGEVSAAASILAMADMGLFGLELQGDGISLSRSDRPKARPEDSAVWNALQRWRAGW